MKILYELKIKRLLYRWGHGVIFDPNTNYWCFIPIRQFKVAQSQRDTI